MLDLPSVHSDSAIVALRPPKNTVDPTRPYAHLVEKERGPDGRIENVAVVFLTNRECPFRCLMCDLWKNTTDVPVLPGQIPGQIRWALDRLPSADYIKLYNSGNFFDNQAIPPRDDAEIAELVSRFRGVIVESHPRLIGDRCYEFHDRVQNRLQVAMGLETVHPEILRRLNKRMTLDDFASAATRLVNRGIAVRAFILVKPPFMNEDEGVTWAKRSLDFAFDVGVECCALIPTRAGNGAMDELSRQGMFEPPTLKSVENVQDYGIRIGRGRVFADLWDIGNLCRDTDRSTERIARLERMNLQQIVEPRIPFIEMPTDHAPGIV